jgi:GAF domain-containing protein
LALETTIVLAVVGLIVMVERTFDIGTLGASEEDGLHFREHGRSLGDHASDLDQGIQVHLSEVSKFILHRQATDSYVNSIVSFMVIRVDLSSDLPSHLIEQVKHDSRFFSQPDCNGGVFATQVWEIDLQALFVISAHLVDPLLIDIVPLVILEVPQEEVELPVDLSNHIGFGEPLG